MSSSLQTLVTVGPLAITFLVLGIWHGGRHPRVIAGQLDFGVLAFGLLGLVAFGPVGQWLMDRLFPGPSVWAQLAVPTFFGLLVLLWAPRTARRLVVYNVDPEIFKRALSEVVRGLPMAFHEINQGFDEVGGILRIKFEAGGRSRIGLVEARGPRDESVLHAIGYGLRSRLRAEPSRPSAWSRLWFVLAAVVLLGPQIGGLGRPQIQAAVRVLLDQMRR